jgi:hypothetical protein
LVEGKIRARFKQPGSIDFGDPYNFQVFDGTSLVDLTVAKDSFHFVPLPYSQTPWMLVVVRAGDVHNYVSYDVKTWTEVLE